MEWFDVSEVPLALRDCFEEVQAECGAPWVRQTTTEYVKSPVHGNGSQMRGRSETTAVNGWAGMPRVARRDTTTGWRPSCKHEGEPVPCTVLDPFGGAGTVGLVADRLARNAILCELSPSYGEQAVDRVANDAPMFTEVSVVEWAELPCGLASRASGGAPGE